MLSHVEESNNREKEYADDINGSEIIIEMEL